MVNGWVFKEFVNTQHTVEPDLLVQIFVYVLLLFVKMTILCYLNVYYYYVASSPGSSHLLSVTEYHELHIGDAGTEIARVVNY